MRPERIARRLSTPLCTGRGQVSTATSVTNYSAVREALRPAAEAALYSRLRVTAGPIPTVPSAASPRRRHPRVHVAHRPDRLLLDPHHGGAPRGSDGLDVAALV